MWRIAGSPRSMSSVVVSTTTRRRCRAAAALRLQRVAEEGESSRVRLRSAAVRPAVTPDQRSGYVGSDAQTVGVKRVAMPRRDADNPDPTDRDRERARRAARRAARRIGAPTLPKPIRIRSNVIRTFRDSAMPERSAIAASPSAIESARADASGLVAEADAQIAVHAEVIAGHDQHALSRRAGA